MRFPRTRAVRAAGAVLAVLALGTACNASAAGPRLAADEPLPDDFPSDTVLRIGDPETQAALELSGAADDLPFEVEWANISGGPQTLEAFRADALDVGSVADIPPLQAAWTGLDVKIVASAFRRDPVNNPIYQLGIAPGIDVKNLEDLEGKKIAYSPGQAQGALILRVLQEAGLEQDDVELVELESTEDVYVDALGSNQVEVAPLGGVLIKTYLAKYGEDGGTTISHGLRDDPDHLYVPEEVLEDADKAAAIAEFVKAWAAAQQWMRDNPDEWIQGYYVDQEGLSEEDGKYVYDSLGELDIPTSWDAVIKRHQATADLLSEEQGQPELDVSELYDMRFEKLAAEGLKEGL